MVKMFVSWSHKDEQLKDRLLDNLRTQLRIREVEFRWWQDSHLLPGEKWTDEILSKVTEADGALHLISPDFLASDFIRHHELKAFLTDSKFTIPVMLRDVPLSGEQITWLTLDARQIFSLHGTDFSSISGQHRVDKFTSQLASQMVERVKRLRNRRLGDTEDEWKK